MNMVDLNIFPLTKILCDHYKTRKNLVQWLRYMVYETSDEYQFFKYDENNIDLLLCYRLFDMISFDSTEKNYSNSQIKEIFAFIHHMALSTEYFEQRNLDYFKYEIFFNSDASKDYVWDLDKIQIHRVKRDEIKVTKIGKLDIMPETFSTYSTYDGTFFEILEMWKNETRQQENEKLVPDYIELANCSSEDWIEATNIATRLSKHLNEDTIPTMKLIYKLIKTLNPQYGVYTDFIEEVMQELLNPKEKNDEDKNVHNQSAPDTLGKSTPQR